jgi:hypothetical protein
MEKRREPIHESDGLLGRTEPQPGRSEGEDVVRDVQFVEKTHAIGANHQTERGKCQLKFRRVPEIAPADLGVYQGDHLDFFFLVDKILQERKRHEVKVTAGRFPPCRFVLDDAVSS